MIDAVPVVEVGAAPRALAQPSEILRGDDVPAIDRHAPVLSRRAERIGRHTERGIQPKLILPRPDVRAVAVDHERQIAKKLHPVRVRTDVLPLGVGDPLQVLLEQHLARQLTARMIDVGRFPALKRVGPLGPRALPLTRMDRTEERVILNPPRLLAEKRLQLPAPGRVAAPVSLEKS